MQFFFNLQISVLIFLITNQGISMLLMLFVCDCLLFRLVLQYGRNLVG